MKWWERLFHKHHWHYKKKVMRPVTYCRELKEHDQYYCCKCGEFYYEEIGYL